MCSQSSERGMSAAFEGAPLNMRPFGDVCHHVAEAVGQSELPATGRI
jgi:hypothetical protein